MRVKIQTKDGHKIINLNRRRAIKERCLNCSGFKYSEIKNCEFFDCPLYAFRSGKGKQNAKARNKAIRQYCLWCCAGQSSEVSKCPALDCPLWSFRNGRIDRSSEIVTTPEKGYIEAFSETN